MAYRIIIVGATLAVALGCSVALERSGTVIGPGARWPTVLL